MLRKKSEEIERERVRIESRGNDEKVKFVCQEKCDMKIESLWAQEHMYITI